MATIFVLGCESLPKDNTEEIRQPLDTQAITALLAGNTISATTSDGPYSAYFTADGEARGRRAPNYRDHGTWWVDGGSWCAQWKEWWGTKPRCWRGYRIGDTVEWVGPDGKPARDVVIEQGNALGL